MQTKCGDGSVMICGLVGKNAETKRVGEKQSVLTKFSVKVGERAVEGQERNQAIWVNCTAWNDMGKVASTIQKGDYILAVGKIHKSTYTNNDGQQKENSELVCEFVTAVLKSCLPTVTSQNNEPYVDMPNNNDLPF